MNKYILLGKSFDELKAWTLAQGLPSFTASQLFEWIYRKSAKSFDEMTNISLQNRSLLKEKAELGLSPAIQQSVSKDGTIKYLFSSTGTYGVEAVFIPENDRATLCVSSQVGCKMHCAFCMTGRMGFIAQLSAAEILNQVLSLPERESLSNIVFMGMGEPADNVDAVIQSLNLLTSPRAMAWSPRRITVSSIGVLPGLKRLLDETQCHIAISLHSADTAQRLSWMPAEKSWPLLSALELLKTYDFSKQRRLSFEYILFKNLNDRIEDAKALLRLLNGLRCRLNLIRFHAFEESEFCASDEDQIQFFANYLNSKGLQTTIRQSRGEDVQAACGMLSSQYKST
ncbi:MAG: 23S rRNA (adenine(2503)-C(2))-methyltransferase RlmN [Bacteroidales bacterium]|nr:23S rRNA (adenine(2503)-C(2))-methyltransferase RlmN [Bacteroidales bacterium]MDD3430697.1 23S rRNA (adenine(2503)-C(2))-methyltransferase RlmN [Bacteroidales bacterium]MDD4361156.1 23S rRNA (adenine(2503)-C(2))-methyltransferase RlmN [Bacteroidales bacterium]MDD4430168.1 23S rRNA (adenine(2503)-C(2))-methyltransferase RlmN [Bacteroidales bacterium]